MPSLISESALYRAGLPVDQAKEIAYETNSILSLYTGPVEKAAPLMWHDIRKEVLKPEHPAAVKRLIYDAAFQGWDESELGPRPTWKPTPEQLASTNISRLMEEHGFKDYDELYQWSIQHGKQFWQEMVDRVGVKFQQPPESLVDTANPKAPKWFPGSTLNITDSLFKADPNAVAIVYQKEGTEELREVTYGELDALSNKVANGLVNQGYKPGDHIALDMPFNVEATYIGIMKAGCTVVCLADSFKAQDLDLRLKQIPSGVKAIFTQDVTGGQKKFPLYDTVVSASEAPPAIVVFGEGAGELKRAGDKSWDDFLAGTSDKFEAVALNPEHNINIIYSSSTSTGKEKDGDDPKPPKAIAWKANTAIKSAIDAHLHHNMQLGKVLNWQTNMGWMMGAFDVFGTLMNKGTLAMYDGNPVTTEYGKFVEKAKVNILGTVPKVAEGWEQTKCIEGCDWSSIEMFSSTGSPSTPKNYFYLMSLVPGFAPVVEYMGGTEIGGGYITGSLHHQASPSMFTTPTLGTELAFPQDKGNDEFARDEMSIVMRTGGDACPPMGLSTELLNFNNEEKYFTRNAEMDGHPLREHGDVIVRRGNFLQSNGRADDGININGIKTSSTELEGFIKDAAMTGKIKGLENVVVVGVRPPEGGDDIIVAFPVMAEGSALKGDALRNALREAIKDRNPQLAKMDAIQPVEIIPITASNKIKRAWMKDNWLEEQLRLQERGEGYFAEGGRKIGK